MLRDIRREDDPQVAAVVDQIVAADADVIALQGIDYDLENRALNALAEALKAKGMGYSHTYTLPPNAGRKTDLDLDGDGKRGGPGDAQGYGRFYGQGSMALLSKYPFIANRAQDFTEMLWRDLPGATLPSVDGSPFPSAAAHAAQRLFAHGAWVVPINHPKIGHVSIMTFHATPPVFDGPEDRNGLRNHDETMFWVHFLNGRVAGVPNTPFILLADANIDPDRGEGVREGIAKLLSHPRLQDPLPGKPTVSFSQTGPLRIDYVLPSVDWQIVTATVMPSDPDASRHSLVWVDLKH